MVIDVEFYGIVRERAGIGKTQVEAGSLGEALEAVGKQFPRLAEGCLAGARLAPGYVANINGERFVTDPATPLADGDAILLLSADAGG